MIMKKITEKDIRTKIPLDTFYDYYADEEGNIYREQTKIKPWRHLSRKPYPKEYYRLRLKMKDGSFQLHFVQRLMGYTYFGLQEDSKEMMLHNSSNGLDNRKLNLRVGNDWENQGMDRLSHGTYWKRGGKRRRKKFKQCA